jgi:hypothetical protein
MPYRLDCPLGHVRVRSEVIGSTAPKASFDTVTYIVDRVNAVYNQKQSTLYLKSPCVYERRQRILLG